MKSISRHLFAVVALLGHFVTAEYEVYAVEEESPGNLEAVVFDDSWVGCVTFLNEVSSWYKLPFDSTTTKSTLFFYSGTECAGDLVGFWYYPDVRTKSATGFVGSNARSIYVTGGADSKKRDYAAPEPSNLTLIFDGTSRKVAPTSDIEARALHRRDADPYEFMINGDHILALVGAATIAFWTVTNIAFGAGSNQPPLPDVVSTMDSWADSITAEFFDGAQTGELNGNFASWTVSFLNGHTVDDFQPGQIRTTMFQALQFAGSEEHGWVSFRIVDWQGLGMASFTLWTEQ